MIKAMFKHKRFRNKKCSFNWTMYIRYVSLYFFDIRNFEYTELPFMDVRKILLYYIKYRLLLCGYILIKKNSVFQVNWFLGRWLALLIVAHEENNWIRLIQSGTMRPDSGSVHSVTVVISQNLARYSWFLEIYNKLFCCYYIQCVCNLKIRILMYL